MGLFEIDFEDDLDTDFVRFDAVFGFLKLLFEFNAQVDQFVRFFLFEILRFSFIE